jgi:hypothetical protein
MNAQFKVPPILTSTALSIFISLPLANALPSFARQTHQKCRMSCGRELAPTHSLGAFLQAIGVYGW